jgi:ATP-binding cassette, subfamily B (MDR/TAP), member 1
VLVGSLFAVIYGGYALAFWYGWKLTLPGDDGSPPEYNVGKIIQIFFSIIIAIFSLSTAAPFIAILTTGRSAAYEIFNIINRKPEIDTLSSEGKILDSLEGDIKFYDVEFNYPSREEVKVLKKINFNIKSGTTVALVGSSGCGKSTCIQLLQRFYNPLNGSISINDVNINDFNIQWLRSQIGVVNQEPILFETTIKENISFGKPDATDQEIQLAAKNANAHNYIMKLPEKYDTLVGNRGSQLSGGQKQRIAIARALISNPKILLLDEATSALDNESEAIVQAALDRASLGRTTIIVAHRLSTIRNADVIFALENGQVAESGTHSQLMEKKGVYYNLVLTQTQSNLDEEGNDENNSNDKNNNRNEKFKVSHDIDIDKHDENAFKRTQSLIEEEENKKKNEEIVKKENEKSYSMLQVFGLNKPEWFYILLGSIGSFIVGIENPAFSYIFAKAINVFSLCSIDDQEKEIYLYCFLFIGIGLIHLVFFALSNGLFGLSGENLTRRLRSNGMKAMLKQDIGWFDQPENNVGTLCTKLSTEASAVKGATGVRIGFLMTIIGNLGIGVTLSFIYAWPIALCIMGFIPFVMIGGSLQMKMSTGFAGKDKEHLEKAGKV